MRKTELVERLERALGYEMHTNAPCSPVLVQSMVSVSIKCPICGYSSIGWAHSGEHNNVMYIPSSVSEHAICETEHSLHNFDLNREVIIQRFRFS